MGCAGSQPVNMPSVNTNIDTNNDGIISRDEFKAAYKREHCKGEAPDGAAWSRYERVVTSTNGKPTVDHLRVG